MLALALLGLFGVGLFWQYERNKDVIIAGVPHYGIFSGTVITTPPQAVFAMIVRYWGDERLSTADIREKLSPNEVGREKVTLRRLAEFFAEQNYVARIERFDTIYDLKKELAKNIPVIISLKLPVENYSSTEHVVLIGALPSKQKIEFHSNFLGNNYKMSFSDFEASWHGRAEDKVYLALEPSASIRSLIKGPDRAKPYSSRLGIMDDPAFTRLRIKWKTLEEMPLSENTAPQWEEIINDPSFAKSRPTGQIVAYVNLAREYDELGQIDEAIRIIKTKALPLNHDLEQAYEEWPAFSDLPPRAEWGLPWTVLGDLYVKKGDRDNAITAYRKTIEVNPDSPKTKAKLEGLLKAER